MAKGEFITIINSDNIFLPDRPAAYLKEFELTGADSMGTDIVVVGDDGRRVTETYEPGALAYTIASA